VPIKAENKHRYPRDWKQIRAEILGRAGHRITPNQRQGRRNENQLSLA